MKNNLPAPALFGVRPLSLLLIAVLALSFAAEAKQPRSASATGVTLGVTHLHVIA